MGRRFVPHSTILRRMQAKDDRMNAEIAAFRRRTRTPTERAADALAAARASFHAFLTDPATGPTLDALLADNARIDAVLADVVVELEIVQVPDAPLVPVVDVVLVPKPGGAK
jgi:hypothetical protein